jgi:hypothetical protein
MLVEMTLDQRVHKHFKTLLEEFNDDQDLMTTTAIDALWSYTYSEDTLLRQVLTSYRDEECIRMEVSKANASHSQGDKLEITIQEDYALAVTVLMEHYKISAKEIIISAFVTFVLLYKLEKILPNEYFIYEDGFDTIEELLDIPLLCLH